MAGGVNRARGPYLPCRWASNDGSAQRARLILLTFLRLANMSAKSVDAGAVQSEPHVNGCSVGHCGDNGRCSGLVRRDQ
jgi:hypothetical protein